MKKNGLLIALMAGALVMTSCASKKDLDNCRLTNQNLQDENSQLNTNWQVTKEQLAAANARVTSLEEQLAQAKKDYAALQGSLDKSLSNASQNNISIEKLVDQINESNQYIRHLVEVKSKSDSLNMVLTNNLTRSLSKEELKEVDVRRLHLTGRQHALQERLLRNQRPRRRDPVEDCQDHHGLQGLRRARGG